MNVVLNCEQIGIEKKEKGNSILTYAFVCSIDLFVFIFFCSCVMPLHNSNQADDKIDSYVHESISYRKFIWMMKKKKAYLSSGGVKLKLTECYVWDRELTCNSSWQWNFLIIFNIGLKNSHVSRFSFSSQVIIRTKLVRQVNALTRFFFLISRWLLFLHRYRQYIHTIDID